MKKGSVIALILIVAAVLVGAIIWMNQDDENGATSTTSTSDPAATEQSEGTETNAGDELTIEYDGSGFTPSTVTISQGDTVTFVNESSTPVWPASNDHPTHTKLSGFDALSGLGQGEEYTFTFEETGEWGYHNHLEPTQTGTIIVE